MLDDKQMDTAVLYLLGSASGWLFALTLIAFTTKDFLDLFKTSPEPSPFDGTGTGIYTGENPNEEEWPFVETFTYLVAGLLLFTFGLFYGSKVHLTGSYSDLAFILHKVFPYIDLLRQGVLDVALSLDCKTIYVLHEKGVLILIPTDPSNPDWVILCKDLMQRGVSQVSVDKLDVESILSKFFKKVDLLVLNEKITSD